MITTTRRDAMKNGLGLASGVILAAAAASPALATTDTDKKFVQTISQCLQVGQACETHCIAQLATGNKDMAACLTTVRETQATCEALMKLVSAESKHVKAFAALAATVCADCAKACDVHAKHMEICKECRDACLACEKACRAAA